MVAGFSDASGTRDFALARYNPDGTLDATFNATGKVLTDFSGEGGGDGAHALAIQADGKIVVAGFSFSSSDPTFTDFALARYNPDGTLDATFNATGTVLTDFRTQDDAATGLAIQSDGKIVAAGTSDTPETSDDFALARYNPDGTLDATFNATGTVLTDVSGSGNGDAATPWRSSPMGRSSRLVAPSRPRPPTTSPWPGTTRTDPWTPPSMLRARS